MSLAPQHIGFQGRPLASRMASDDELRALCRMMRELDRGIIEILPNRGSTSWPDEGGFDLLTMLARESARPVTWLALLDLPGTPPDAHQRNGRAARSRCSQAGSKFCRRSRRGRSSSTTRCAIRSSLPRSIRGRECSTAAPTSRWRSCVRRISAPAFRNEIKDRGRQGDFPRPLGSRACRARGKREQSAASST